MVLPVNLDMDVLRSFAVGIDLGSFAKAASRLGRSPSAISLQLRKLEDQVGQQLVQKHGRGLVLTEAGEMMLGYARRLLDLNDAAVSALGSPALTGSVRIGLPQDFAETWLPETLGRFARPASRSQDRRPCGSKRHPATLPGGRGARPRPSLGRGWRRAGWHRHRNPADGLDRATPRHRTERGPSTPADPVRIALHLPARGPSKRSTRPAFPGGSRSAVRGSRACGLPSRPGSA